MALGETQGPDQSSAAAPVDVKATKGRPALDLLSLCREEMRRAVGFEQDAELRDAREMALRYFKGDVSKEIPSLANRSKAVSSDVSDAVEGLLPDLMEVFIGGDDVVAFKPIKNGDEDAAKQETAYLHHVVFQDNPGFLNFHTAISDALLLKLGIFHWEWEEEINEQTEEFTGKNAIELHLAAVDGTISNVKAEQTGPRDLRDTSAPEATYSFTLTKTKDLSRAKYWPVAPDDFAAAPDTVMIADTTYCVERQRPRVQDLIARGFDEAKVRALEPYSFAQDQVIQQARDTAGENDNNGGVSDDTSAELRQVEVRKHCIRVLGDDNKLTLWCVYTDAEAAVELLKEEIESIPYACGSPYLVAHRLIGRSVADLLIDTMQIKTAGLRMLLDSGYFAINQRFEVAADASNAFTISDLLRNEPNVPVRSKTGNAVRALSSGGLSFDPYKMLEYFATVGEQKTGIVRNAQGLNPDTLHDTATGAMALLSAAQKRVRMIARVLSETLVKPLFLGMHACIRENSTSTSEAQLLGKWVPVDPSKWAERNAMTVEVGLGAAGKDAEIAAINQIAVDMKNIVDVQGGAQGPLVTLENVYRLATDKAKKLGVKDPSEYYTDPNSPEGQQAQQAAANRPNPAVQAEQAKGQVAIEIASNKATVDAQTEANKAQAQSAVTVQANQLEHERAMALQASNENIEQMRIASAERIEQMRMESAERIAIETSRIKAEGMIAAALAKADAAAASAELDVENTHETTTA